MPLRRSTKASANDAGFNYRYEPVIPSEGETSKEGAISHPRREDGHFSAFSRSAIPSSSSSSSSRCSSGRKARARQQLALESDESDADTPSSLSSASDEASTFDRGNGRPDNIEPDEESALAAELFNVGDAVYIASNIAHPHLGIITDIFVQGDSDDNEGEEGPGEEPATSNDLFCTVRFMYWPKDVSAVTSKKLDRLVDEDEVYYTHQAPRLGRRRTKNSLRGGGAVIDNFQHGPSLLFMTVHASGVLGKVALHSSPDACREAEKNAVRSCGTLFKRKRWPQHLYVQRAIDPQREVFWRVDWGLVARRGIQTGSWDLVEGDDDIRCAQKEHSQVPQGRGGEVASPLDSPGKNADEWARILAKERGISLRAPVDRDAVRKQKEAARIAALLDTPSQRRRARKAAKLPYKARRDSIRVGMSDEDNLSDDESSSESDDSTAMTSDDEYIDKGYMRAKEDRDDSDDDDDEEMHSSDEDADEWLSTPRRATTGAKKRKRGRPAKAKYDVVTPRKRRALYPSGISPAKAVITPRSKARLLGTVAKAPTSLPARPVPLNAMPKVILASLSPQDRAKRLLHVGATPESLPCRSEQYDEVMACLEDAVEEGLGGCVYVSGVPGTGKTATVREVIRALQRRAETNEISPFNFVEINGMKLQDAHDTYGVLWHALTGMRCSNPVALHHLGQHFGTRNGATANRRGVPQALMASGPGRATTIVLMDELDQLVTARQDVMYNMFNWPNGLDSRLVVVAIANTMDLPERVLHPKVASRLGMTRITFRPYSDKQLIEIVHARLGIQRGGQSDESQDNTTTTDATDGCSEVFAPDALVYLAKRISNVSGDARRMLDVSRRAIDAVQDSKSSASSCLPRPVIIADVKRVLDVMVKSGKGAHIARLSLHAKVALMAVLASVRRSGLAEITLGDVTAAYTSLCRLHAIAVPDPVSSLLPSKSLLGGAHGKITATSGDTDDSARLGRSARLLDSLCALGLIVAVSTGTAGARSGQYARYMLGCSHDEVRLALEHDGDGRVRGML